MVFRFLVGRTAKFFGRTTNLLFFTSLYREMYKEIVDITKDETEASRVLKNIGIHGTFESGKRQIAVLRMFPNDPVKIMEYLDVIWYVIFGTKLDEYEMIKVPQEGKHYPDLIFRISKCPICGGYGSSPLDSVNCDEIQSSESYYATGLVGMLEETANFILELKKNDYRIQMQETKCFCRGDNVLELKCHILHKSEFIKDIKHLDEALQRPFLLDSEIKSTNDILSKPLDAIKEQLVSLVQDKLQMSTFDFLEYFQGYEEDVVKIAGFLLIHLFNENGRIIEKACETDSIAKLIGHVYNTSIEMTKLTLPFDVLNDYKKLIVELLTDIAPTEMIERFNGIEPTEFIHLFYEGMKKALCDLGVNFEGLKSNIWEEMDLKRVLSSAPSSKKDDELTEEQKQEQIDLKIQLIQEVFTLLMGLSVLPSRILLSSLHGAARSIFSSGEESASSIRDGALKILELIEKLK